jgi:hypothetical protein
MARTKQPPARKSAPAMPERFPWCHLKPKRKWCDHSGPGGFMGHTCKPPSFASENLDVMLKTPPVIRRALFDAVIDCLYEYDLGQELPVHWPLTVRRSIEAARQRIMRERTYEKTRRIVRARQLLK